MDIIQLKELEYFETNLEEDTTPLWLNTAGYALDTIRRIDKKLYQSLDKIDPLATYAHDNTDLLSPNKVLKLDDETTVVNTSVPCVQNETVVYNKDNNVYYLYKDITTDLDFTTTNFADTNIWIVVTDYRNSIFDPITSPTKWEDLGYTNKYKCLDASLSSRTISNQDITMSFNINKIDSLFFFNLLAESITIRLVNIADNSLINEETLSLSSKNGGTWYNYFFNDTTHITTANFNIPLSYNTRIEITIKALGNTCEVGLVGLGRVYNIGSTLYGASLGMVDYSKKETNSEGETYLKEGNFKIKNTVVVDTDTARASEINDFLISIRATPVIFNGATNTKALKLFGTFKDYSILINGPVISKLNLQLESLV